MPTTPASPATPITLSETDHSRLQTVVHRGHTSARTRTRAQVLLKLGEGWSEVEVCDAFDVCRNTVVRVRTRFAEGGADAVLSDKRQERRRAALTGGQQAHLIAIACSEAPQGHDHWTLRLLAGKAVALGFVESISPEPIRALLKKNELKPWQHHAWCIPTVGADFVAAMEAVLDLYEDPYDPEYPTVCLDEKPVVLHEPARPSLPATPAQPGQPDEPGHVERRDYAYVRQGAANLFVMVEPLAGWRHVAVTAQRTKRDFAECLRYLVEERYPTAQYVRLVLDNLNTHGLAVLYEAFPPARARAIAERLEWHYTPKHGSWLNMAEIEISGFERGCLSRPVGDEPTVQRRVSALETERNAAHCTIHWQFTSRHARTKLADLYPLKQTQLD